ncbi:macrocin O-methyltransferase [Polynucleobacter paneuropaeus]|nr:macrocin O-methyltransferase [Polynucleobacter paneuropaeus]
MTNAQELYINLMKKILVNEIYDEHEYLIKDPQSRINEAGINQFIGVPRKIDPLARDLGQIWPPTKMAHTMIGRKRLENLQFCIESIISDQVPGDLIETGVWRGGATIFMKACLKALGENERAIWVADSFEGLPPPSPLYSPDSGDVHHTYPELAVSLEKVQDNFRKYDLLDDKICFLKGWFSKTLKTDRIRQLAIIRLDGDMYESTIDALSALYPKLNKGGFLIVDDYCLKPCAQAIHDYRKEHNIHDEIIDIDGSGVFWRKI